MRAAHADPVEHLAARAAQLDALAAVLRTSPAGADDALVDLAAELAGDVRGLALEVLGAQQDAVRFMLARA